MFNLKNKSLYIFSDTYFGKDSNGMSIFDRVIGVVKRKRKQTDYLQDIIAESKKESKNMEEFSLSEEEILLASLLAFVYTK